MLKCASVHTYEIDDPVIALEEIKARLGEKISLLEHTVGVIMCHPEFVVSGVTEHICKNLPFKLVGATSSAQAVNGEAGELILTLFVLTSNDIRFKTGVTGSLLDDVFKPTAEAYKKAAEGHIELPGLALVFPPLMPEYSGDDFVDAWERVIPGTPVFGSIAIEDDLPFDDSETIHIGQTYKTSMTFILCYGNINPRFLIGTLDEKNTVPYKGEITKSKGSYVHEINNINAYKYFERLGFAADSALIEKYGFVLYVIDQKKRDDYDGVPVVRGLAGFTEDGTAVFRGAMDEGSTFCMLTSDYNGVLSTTQEIIKQIDEFADINGVLLFSCIVRRMVIMRAGNLKELEAVRDTIKPDIPYMIGYAGGELCPTSIISGKPTNRFHNYSLVILII